MNGQPPPSGTKIPPRVTIAVLPGVAIASVAIAGLTSPPLPSEPKASED